MVLEKPENCQEAQDALEFTPPAQSCCLVRADPQAVTPLPAEELRKKGSSVQSSLEWWVQLHRELLRGSSGSWQGLTEKGDAFKGECPVGGEAS